MRSVEHRTSRERIDPSPNAAIRLQRLEPSTHTTCWPIKPPGGASKRHAAPTSAPLGGRPIALLPLAEALADRCFDESSFPEALER